MLTSDAMIPILAIVFFTILLQLQISDAALCYSNFTVRFTGPLYPLDPYGLSGHYADLWSNQTKGDTTFQVWLLSYNYDQASPKSFFLSLVAIRNPDRPWDLVNPLILWTAKRDDPVQENATLKFGVDGDLQLLDNGKSVWSTNTSNQGVKQLCITDNARIVLRNSSDDVKWKSSDEPTDTLLLQRPLKTGSKLVSWISKENSSSGPYSFVMEKNGLALLFNSEPYWIFSFSGANTTKSIAGNASSVKIYAVFCWQRSGITSLDFRTNFSQISPAELVLPDSCKNSSPKDRRMQLPVNGSAFNYATFIKLQSNGELVLYSWGKRVWQPAFNFSSLARCFLPNSCGAYRICNRTSGSCGRSCPSNSSFELKDGVCRPTASIHTSRCEEVEFVEVNDVDYFSTRFRAPQLVSASKEDCINFCKLNCTCRAAFFKESTGACFQTHADVQSLQTGDYVAFLKIAKPKEHSQRRIFQMIALGILLPALVSLILCLVCVFKQQKTQDDFVDEEEESLEFALRQCMPTRFTYQELQQITNNFSECLGNGGFGSVYKGGLTDGTEVAVKKLEGSNQRSRDFYAEVAILANTRHWNLVKLLGYCAEGSRKRLLVYEFMIHGSLERWIFENDENPTKLHEECDERIIHLDLKPENVLLDSAFQPKIADFGLSKLVTLLRNACRKEQ